MAIVTLEDVKAQLSLTPDQTADDTLIQGKIDAAQSHIERLLGFRIGDRFGGEGQEPIPPDLKEAVLQLADWWFENREAVNVGNIVTAVPFNVTNIVNEYREWSF
ncbi:head-tail connector protein [Paracoccus sp. (in: a-proteobacteria)]|uniref:head-tail connector protein n=1 Tax=Paracoccus sp. TaxID=267 RepID=UPI0028ABFAAF|nr:head-tail connector protein [Paracoccus sp. (in: a-proteobacteria)]